MVVDRVHRTPRVLPADAKAILRDVAGAGPVRAYVGGVVLNHLGWAAALGLRTGIFGRQPDDADGRFLRAAMDALGIEHQLIREGSATSLAEIFVDDAGARAIYMAPGATAETSAAQVCAQHADFIRRAARVTTEVSQLPLAAALAALEIARAAGIATVVDVDVPPSEAVPGLGDAATLDALLRAADLLKPAKQAAREIVPARRLRPARDGARHARALRVRSGGGDGWRGGLRDRRGVLRGLRAGARGESRRYHGRGRCLPRRAAGRAAPRAGMGSRRKAGERLRRGLCREAGSLPRRSRPRPRAGARAVRGTSAGAARACRGPRCVRAPGPGARHARRRAGRARRAAGASATRCFCRRGRGDPRVGGAAAGAYT